MQTKKLDLVPVDGSLGVVLPEETLARLGLKVGDWVGLDETPQGFILIPDCHKSDDAASFFPE